VGAIHVESSVETLNARLDAVRGRIRAAAERAGRSPEDIALVVVTKGVPAERIHAAAALGVADFGESRLQEALPKIVALDAEAIRWHLVGHLQRNKARRAAGVFALIHSVDSPALAETLAGRGETQGRSVPVLLQVNVAREPGKRGFAPAEVLPAARRLQRLAGLRLEGLMTIAPLVRDPEEVRPIFRQLRRLGEALREEAPEAGHLSMGMSDDFEVAIEEGATLIRVGRALFCERPTP
jgi:hypothetical protein